MYKIEITAQGESDLRNIYEYIAFELCSPESAVNKINRQEEGIMELSQIPERFRVYEKEPWSAGELGLCQ